MSNKKIKVLSFYCRGEQYLVNEEGHINANNIGYFSSKWLFLGGTKHHWSNRIQHSLKDAFENPQLLNGCLGWDRDHGTLRQWGGRYNGKLPRISGAQIITIEQE